MEIFPRRKTGTRSIGHERNSRSHLQLRLLLPETILGVHTLAPSWKQNFIETEFSSLKSFLWIYSKCNLNSYSVSEVWWKNESKCPSRKYAVFFHYSNYCGVALHADFQSSTQSFVAFSSISLLAL